MLSDSTYPLAASAQLVADFENCRLAGSAWTHQAHLISGLAMLARFGPQQALPEMRRRITAFNLSVGVENTDTRGYHETLTVFWLWAIWTSRGRDEKPIRFDQESLDQLLSDASLIDRNRWAPHYSKERILSVEARRAYLSPDLQPMDRVAQLLGG